MSGKGALSGFYYQIAVGVLRLLSMLNESGPFKIVFEEIDDDSEDIVCFYESYTEYEQVKRRDNRSWPPSAVKSVISRFFQREIESKKDIIFKFTTNSIPSVETAESDVLIRNIQNGITDFSESEILHRLIPDDIGTERKKEVIDKLSIIWAFSYSPDPRDTIKAIRELCISRISKVCELDYKNAETIFVKLHELVSHYSSSQLNCIYRSDVREILPRCFARINKDVLQKIPEECKKIIEIQNFDYLECERKIIQNGEFKIPLYTEKGNRRICFWFYGPCDDTSLVRVIEVATKNLEDFIHFIVLRGEVSANVFPVRLRKRTIHCVEETELKLEN